MEEFKLILNYYISVCGSYNYINSYTLIPQHFDLTLFISS